MKCKGCTRNIPDWRAIADSELPFPPFLNAPDFLWLPDLPLYRDKVFLHQKYLEEGLSIGQIAAQIFSSKDAVRRGLKRAGIPIRETGKPHGRLAQPRFGQKK